MAFDEDLFDFRDDHTTWAEACTMLGDDSPYLSVMKSVEVFS
jgi:hypothetical protein